VRATRQRVTRPLTDDEWQGSLRRDPQAAYDEIIALARDMALAAPRLTTLTLRLPSDVASTFLASLDVAAARVLAPIARHRAGDAAVRTFATSNPSYRASLGLFAMLVSYAAQWDPSATRHPEHKPQVFRRDGYRCTAPGCTNRTGLHDHHIRYRSLGGDDAEANRTTLCAFHHQDGEHGGLMQVRGTAPLALTFRVGRAGRGAFYRNDRRVGR
jgi:hypothetical protein